MHLQLAVAAGIAILGTAAFCKVIIVMLIVVMLMVEMMAILVKHLNNDDDNVGNYDGVVMIGKTAKVMLMVTMVMAVLMVMVIVIVMAILMAKMKVEWSVKSIKLAEQDNCCGVIDDQEQQLNGQ